MAQSIFPMGAGDVEPERESRVVAFADADAMIEALSSRTAREVLATLEEEPLPPAALAERVDTSLQNVLYHLEQLTEAGLVTVVETSYSVRGNEMDVYAPAADPVVICVGDRGSEDAVTRVLSESEADDEPEDRDEGIAM